MRTSPEHDGFQARETPRSPAHASSGFHDQSDLAPSEMVHGGIVVPHAELLFSGDYRRSGEDLVISKSGETFTVSNYFRGQHHGALFSPDGASLTGDVVDALTGHSVYAQAGPAASSASAIGHVVKLTGNASAIRNGVAVELHIGDNVFKGDVVQAGSDSLLGLSFVDGTAFSLSSNARMVLNEMVYDPLGSSNSSLLSLVQGTISFVAGETAKHGTMNVETPVATMGIRGTAVLVEISADNGPTNFSVLVEPGQITGSFMLYDKITKAQLGSVSHAGQVTVVTPMGANHFTLSEHVKSQAELLAESYVVQQVFSIAFPQFNLNDTNPHGSSPIGSGVTPLENLAIYPTYPNVVITAAQQQTIASSSDQKQQSTSLENPILAPSFAAGFFQVLLNEHLNAAGSVGTTLLSPFQDPGSGNSGNEYSVSILQTTATGDTAGLPQNAAALDSLLRSFLAVDVTKSSESSSGLVTELFSALGNVFAYLPANKTVTIVYTIQLQDYYGASTTEVSYVINGANNTPQIIGETDPAPVLVQTLHPVVPDVLPAGQNVNTLGLASETFQELPAGMASNNGAGAGDFYSAALGATFFATGNAGITEGTSAASAAPLIGSSPDTANYLSVGANGTETIVFNSEQNAFGLYWGSVDSYNTIAFYDGSNLVAIYSGTDVNPLSPTGSQNSPTSNGYVEFSGLGSFDKVVLSSAQNAFEIASISAGFLSSPHTEPIGPISGTLSAADAHIGDTMTASVEGNATILYDGGSALPANADVTALIAAGAISFNSVTTDGGTDVLTWTYDPTGTNLDFLKSGDTLTITYMAEINDGSGSVGSQPLTITIVGESTADSASAPQTSSTIAGGAMLELDASGSPHQNVVFAGSTGLLILDNPASFAGLISGFSGDGTLAGSDQVDLKHLNFNSDSFSESFNPATDTLSVNDGTNSATLHLVGSYSSANFSFVSDGNGGTIVYDPPVSSGPSPNANVAATSVPPTAAPLAVNVPNETLAGSGRSDVFLFKFPAVGHTAITGSDAAADALHLGSSPVATVQALLAAMQEHENLDAHHPVTAMGAFAHPGAADFHII
jgi:hypothetical protein